ncbi:HNH endonuclease [Fortiea sp. LEGE XX443]|uniref:HNH endonuclease n=1 Tax=Fortiea sp. LEGE XX443 TaxID=1828611 RepID=UPI0018806279|nr:HNH endonuclease [Fortiea sp. LEGE XX443]MBE9005655.1 HNH endonuclease [Fortiea sp. LEGE XX443]
MATIIFLCNGDAEYYTEKRIIPNKDLPEEIKLKFLRNKDYYRTSWSCGNSKFIKVGDRAYFKTSGNIGNYPNGFIAAGHVIAAPKDDQLKRLDRKYSDLSEAYLDVYDNGCFSVYIQIDSIVDFNIPLEQKDLKKLSGFKGVNFNFGGSGCRFDENAAAFLDSEWEKHSLIQQRQKRGSRLVDVFFDQGEACKQNKEYHAAIEAYKSALKVNPKYSKAIYRINICESILKASADKPIIKPPFPDESKLITARKELDKEKFLTFKSYADACEKITVSIARRQGQQKFRQSLLEVYFGRCAITNFDAEAALEAAHIIPYIETENNEPSNGLLLRADLHTLFDLNLITINPETMKVHIHPTLQKTAYRTIEGKEIQVPEDETRRPNKQFLKQRLEQCEWWKNV